jgi:hypothetical protein
MELNINSPDNDFVGQRTNDEHLVRTTFFPCVSGPRTYLSRLDATNVSVKGLKEYMTMIRWLQIHPFLPRSTFTAAMTRRGDVPVFKISLRTCR